MAQHLFNHVGELVDYLNQWPREHPVMRSVDGNTWTLSNFDIRLWDESDPESPVTFFSNCED